MSVIEDYLNSLGLGPRIAQHIQNEKDKLTGKQGLLPALLSPVTVPLDLLGLGLEGTAAVGKAAAGEVNYGLNAAQAAVGDPNSISTQNAQHVLQIGPGNPGGIQDFLRNNNPDHLTAILSGALEMAADPANLIPLPVGHAAQATETAARAARKGATAVLSDEFLKGMVGSAGENDIAERAIAAAKARATPAALPAFAPDVIPTAGPDLHSALERANQRVTRVQGAYDQAKTIYGETAAARQQATQDYRQGVLNGKQRLPRGLNQDPQYLAGLDEAKLRATPQGPGLPNHGQSFASYTAPVRGRLTAVQQQAQLAQDELRNSFANDTPGVQNAVAAGVDPAVARARSTQLGELNDRFNKQPGGPEYVAPQADAKWLDPDPEATVPPIPDQTLAPSAGTKVPTGRARTVFEQMMQDLGPTDTPEGFRAKLDIVNTHLKQQGYNLLDEHSGSLPFAQGPVLSPDDAAEALVAQKRGTLDEWFARPADQRDPVRAIATEVANPLKAQNGSRPEQEPGYVSHMWDLIKYALGKGVEAQKAAYARPPGKVTLKSVGDVWSGINIQTVKNLIQDPIYNRWLLSNEGIRQRYITQQEKLIASRLTAGETDPLALFGNLGDYMAALGLKVEDSKVAAWAEKQLGGNFFNIEADTANKANELNALQKAGIGTGLQLASPTRAVTGLLTAPGNLLLDMRAQTFHIINNVTHSASRVAAFEDAFLPFIQNSAKDMLARASTEGLDTSLLATNRGFSRAGEELATDGFFTPEEVTTLLGERYGAEWGKVVQQAFDTGFQNSKRVLGNYQLDGALGSAEQLVRRFVPFMSWSWRAYPRAGKYALQHPAVGLALAHLYAADRANAQAEGRPGYQVGGIPITKDTPLLGLLASVFTPEQEATARINPLTLFSPVSGDLLGAGMDQGNGDPLTAYQQAKGALGLVGGSFNPLIQTGAYVTGQDYSAPANASRYSPIDQEVGNLTGIEAPTIQGPLRAARKAVTTALGNPQPDNYDPVEAKAKELVFEQTGKPLEDPSNHALALQVQQHTGIYKQAEDDYLKGNALKAGFNAVAPTSVAVTTNTTAARQAATQGVPFSYNDIKQAQDQGLPQLVKAMNAANTAYYQANPAAAINQKATLSQTDTQDPRLTAFQAQPENEMLRQLAPKAYAARLADYKKTLNIK